MYMYNVEIYTENQLNLCCCFVCYLTYSYLKYGYLTNVRSVTLHLQILPYVRYPVHLKCILHNKIPGTDKYVDANRRQLENERNRN